jgi:hypothetical protein
MVTCGLDGVVVVWDLNVIIKKIKKLLFNFKN